MKLAFVLVVIVAFSADAQTPLMACHPSEAKLSGCRPIGQLCRTNETAATCPPLLMLTYPGAPPPFNMTMRFVDEIRYRGSLVWRYAKIAQPACTPAQMAEKNAYGEVCRAPVGTIVVQAERFRWTP